MNAHGENAKKQTVSNIHIGGQMYGNHRFKSVQMQALLQMHP